MRALNPSILYFVVIAVSLSLTIFCFVVDAQNVTVTFSDLDLTKDQKILIYNSTGHLIGEFNSTDTVELDANNSYIFVLKPSEVSWFSNPWEALNLLKATVPTYLSVLIFSLGIISGLFLIVRILK